MPATFLVQFWGLSLTGATVAALIVGCGPPMVAFFARLFLGERLGKIGWTAVGASTLGVALAVARPGASNNWLGDALVLLSLLAVVGWVLLGKRLGEGYPAVPATAWILTFGTLTLAPGRGAQGQSLAACSSSAPASSSRTALAEDRRVASDRARRGLL